ncbi:thymidylate kinase [Streptomyces paromomycinus]|uniref:Thymidylate kinase n=1 Tax=Streptomyces paromomycinus TaxID=92743 RepID=A0A401VXF7_STREY|nr:thymidylate kinase [Streptomyces paromomycinus]
MAVEGLCLAGKSTLAAALAGRLGAQLMPEYADWAPLPAWPPNDEAAVRTALEFLAAVEQERQCAASRYRVVVFDRCPLSLAAHEAGMRVLGVPADVTHAARLFATTPMPDAVLHLTVPEPVARERLLARGPLPPHLIAPPVRAAMTGYYTAALARLPGRVRHLDATRPLPQLLDQALDFLHRLAPQAAGCWVLPAPQSTGRAL